MVKYSRESGPQRTLYTHGGWGLESAEPVVGGGSGRVACRARRGFACCAGQKRRHALTGIGVTKTIDCNESTLIVLGSGNTVTALGTCCAVTVQGSSNIVVADNVINDITVDGNDQTVFYKNGEPFVWDRGRELGMTNRIDRVPA